ncbi:MAG: hypothetical protein MJ132_04840, partial [Clostridia bacterium]|nr:hypothetical protein [Clostridia bacterium]
MSRLKRFLQTAVVLMLCLTVFGGMAFLYLRFVPPAKMITTDTAQHEILYELPPENAAVICRMPSGKAVTFSLDFAENTLTVFNVENGESLSANRYVCVLDRELLIDLIDRVGGLEMEIEGQKLRLPGVQAISFFERRPTAGNRQKLLYAFTKQVARYGLDRDDLQALFQNGSPTLPDAALQGWPQYL